MKPPDALHRRAAAALSWSGRDWAALLLLAALTALFFWRILTPNMADRASFPPGDFSYQFWAFSTFEARELSAGRLPLWNPHTYAGSPFWADIQSAVLYPLSLVTLLLSGPWGFSLFALEVEAIVHFWLAGIFTYLFVRRLTCHRSAALFAAITFAFGGYLTGYPSQQLAVLETNVWLPLLLFFTDRALVDRSADIPHLHASKLDVIAAGLVWGLTLLAGHPQSALFVFYTFALYVIFLLPSRYSLLPSSLLILLIGLGISAIAWLPGLEYMRLSVRAGGTYDAMSGGFPLYDIIQMLLPGSVSFYSPLYVGILPLLLGLWFILKGRRGKPGRREAVFWGAVAFGALLLAFGGETFLYTPLYLLAPGFSIFRDQERAAFLVSFALAILAGYGFKYQIATVSTSQRHEKQIASDPQSQISNLKSTISWLLIAAIALVILFFYGLNNAGWQADSPFYLLLNRSVWLTIVLALIGGALQLAGRWGSRPGVPSGPFTTSSWLAIGYLVIAILDLFTVNWKTNLHPSLSQAQTAVPALVQAIKDDAMPDEIFRVYNEYRLYENYGVPYKLEDTWGASPLRLARYDEMVRSLRMERVWELLNVKYVITWRKELYVPSEIIYQEMVGDETTYVHRLNQVTPRAWLVYQVQQTDDGSALPQLDALGFDPAETALVPPGTTLAIQPPPAQQSGQVEIRHRDPNSLTLDVTATADGLLILSEIHYPGWQAMVDNQPAGLVRVDYVLRGVPVPAGYHQVELFFKPNTFIWGSLVSGTTMLALAVSGFGLLQGRKSR